jgi:hypothetical protein
MFANLLRRASRVRRSSIDRAPGRLARDIKLWATISLAAHQRDMQR